MVPIGTRTGVRIDSEYPTMARIDGCTKGKKKPKLKGRTPRFSCRRCGWEARKKGALCKPDRV